ncbi:hypothetical protein K3723_02810 [Leisingera caerulea]|uniref:hypothetical protein n=1 Tax=Leisingera caerulea TaxID=506591 RepID=UPI0021A5CFC9|nr:hypothetical protein [Leisingera caerulea]UWQ63248.1 hypothetical protein K3723_02810 [Leisingera caerulea]
MPRTDTRSLIRKRKFRPAPRVSAGVQVRKPLRLCSAAGERPQLERAPGQWLLFTAFRLRTAGRLRAILHLQMQADGTGPWQYACSTAAWNKPARQ